MVKQSTSKRLEYIKVFIGCEQKKKYFKLSFMKSFWKSLLIFSVKNCLKYLLIYISYLSHQNPSQRNEG